MTQNAIEIDFGPQDRKREIEGFLSVVVDDMSNEQKQRVIELSREITELDRDEMAISEKVETAYLYAKVAREVVADLNDEQLLQIVNDLDELALHDRDRLDSFELPILYEIAEAQEVLALAIQQEVMGEVAIKEDVVARVQAIVCELSEAAEDLYEKPEQSLDDFSL